MKRVNIFEYLLYVNNKHFEALAKKFAGQTLDLSERPNIIRTKVVHALGRDHELILSSSDEHYWFNADRIGDDIKEKCNISQYSKV